VRLSNLFRPTEEDPDRFDEALKRASTVYRRAVEHYEERGIQTLFVAVGMATWVSSTSSAVPSAPVLLCPLSLIPRGAARTDFDLALYGAGRVAGSWAQLLETESEVQSDTGLIQDALQNGAEGGDFDGRRVFQLVGKQCEAVPGFVVTDRTVVGPFAYTKLPM